MRDITEIKEQIRQHVLAEFLPGETSANLRDDTPLRTSGILDSMATLQLVNFVESHYGIEVEPHEAGVEHFDRIGDIASLIVSKREEKN